MMTRPARTLARQQASQQVGAGESVYVTCILNLVQPHPSIEFLLPPVTREAAMKVSNVALIRRLSEFSVPFGACAHQDQI